MKLVRIRCKDEDDEVLDELSELSRTFILPSFKFPANLVIDFDGRTVTAIEKHLQRIERNIFALQSKVTQARRHFDNVKNVAEEKQKLLENNKILKQK